MYMKECLVRNLLPLAMRYSEEYERFLAETTADSDEPYTPKTWDQLSEGFRYSNIRQVEKIEEKLESINCQITTDISERNTADGFTEEEKLELAVTEHRMWVEEREEAGWVYGPKRDDKELIHPDMKPWSQLDDPERKKDFFFAERLIPILEEFRIYVHRGDPVTEEVGFTSYYTRPNIPLILSVTGHTDISPSDVPYIEQCLSKLLKELMTDDKSNDGFRRDDIILLSALAEGSDRIVARWAMRNGIHVGPVLPVSMAAYEDTFTGTGYGQGEDGSTPAEMSKRDFRSILDDDMVYSPVIISNGKRNRVRAFAELGAYMVSNSHILIGIWDGRRYDARGGTYDTIRMAYEGVDQDLVPSMPSSSPVFGKFGTEHTQYLNAGEDTLIYWIETDRTSGQKELGEKFCVKEDLDRSPKRNCGYFFNESIQVFESGGGLFTKLKDHMDRSIHKEKRNAEEPTVPIRSGTVFNGISRLYRDVPLAFEITFDRMRAINLDIDEHRRRFGDEHADKQCLYGEGTDVSGETVSQTGCMDDMESRFIDIFEISEHFKRRNMVESRALLLLQSIVTVLFSLMILFSGAMVLNISYSVLYIGVTYYMWRHSKFRVHRKYVEYRAIAESVRVQFYWGIMGINDTVTMNCYGYLKNGMSWMRAVLKGYCSAFTNDYGRSLDVDLGERTAFVKKYWIDEKLHYIDKDEKDRITLANRTSAGVEVLEGISMLLAFILSVCTILYMEKLDDTWIFFDGKFVKEYVIFPDVNFNLGLMLKLMMILAAFVLSLFVSFRSRLFTDTPQQSQAKHLMYTLALKKLEDIDTAKGTHETRNEINRLAILHEIGKQEIDQNNDWVFEFIGRDVKKLKTGLNLRDSGGGMTGGESI